MNNNFKIKRNSRLIAKEINKDYLVFDPEKEKLHTLNKSAAIIYKYLWKPRKIADITTMMTKNFSVSKTKIEKDITCFVENGLGSGLLVKFIDSKS